MAINPTGRLGHVAEPPTWRETLSSQPPPPLPKPAPLTEYRYVIQYHKGQGRNNVSRAVRTQAFASDADAIQYAKNLTYDHGGKQVRAYDGDRLITTHRHFINYEAEATDYLSRLLSSLKRLIDTSHRGQETDTHARYRDSESMRLILEAGYTPEGLLDEVKSRTTPKSLQHDLYLLNL